MRRILLAAMLALPACTLHVTDATRDAEMTDLLTRVQRLEQSKADAQLVGQALQQSNQSVAELKAKVDALPPTPALKK